MATGGSVPSTSSSSLRPTEAEPTECSENPHHGGIAGEMARNDSSHNSEGGLCYGLKRLFDSHENLPQGCIDAEALHEDLPYSVEDTEPENRSMADSTTHRHIKELGLADDIWYELELLSGYIKRITNENAKKITERYFQDIKRMIGSRFRNDAAIINWMNNVDEELEADADTEVGEPMDVADRARNEFAQLRDLAILFIIAPLDPKCRELQTLDASETSKRYKAFLKEKDPRAVQFDRLMIIAGCKQMGEPKQFKTIEYALNRSCLLAILTDSAFSKFVEIEKSNIFSSEWKLVIIQVNRMENNTRTKRFLGSQNGNVGLFNLLCQEIEKLCRTFVQDETRRIGITIDYMDNLKFIKDTPTSVIVAEVTCVEHIENDITTFMTDYGSNSKTVFVFYNGHGYQNGDLSLDDHSAKQMTFLNALHKNRGVDLPRSIEMVWICCYSYVCIEEQKRNEDPRIEVIQRKENVYENLRAEGASAISRLRSIHLTCEEMPTTHSSTNFVKKKHGRGTFNYAYSDDARHFAGEQNRIALNTSRLTSQEATKLTPSFLPDAEAKSQT